MGNRLLSALKDVSLSFGTKEKKENTFWGNNDYVNGGRKGLVNTYTRKYAETQ